MRNPRYLTVVLTLTGALLGAPLCRAAVSLPRFKVFTQEPGVYRVDFDDLVAPGLEGAAVPTEAVGVANRGTAIPIWVEDGGDGRFGPGDWLEFVAEHLPGDNSYYNVFSALNVYWIDLEGAWAKPGKRVPPRSEPCGPGVRRFHSRHLEEDLVRARFPRQDEAEIWYWAQLNYLSDPAFETDLDLTDLDGAADGHLMLHLQLRGWSQLPGNLRGQHVDHSVEVLLDGEVIERSEWNNDQQAENGWPVEIHLPAADLEPGRHRLALRVPQRKVKRDPLIDMALLNWIEVRYPRSASVADDSSEVEWSGATAPACLSLRTDRDEELRFYSGDWRAVTHGISHAVEAPSAAGRAEVVAGSHFRRPVRLEVDVPSTLSATDRQADYIVISHPRLLPAIESLAEYHRSTGLTVAVADVTDVYDEFNDGILSPVAIRRFLRHTYDSWQRPAPRFVLLVGDASWDSKNPFVDDRNYADWTFRLRRRGHADFLKNQSTPYESQAGLNHRNLVPTWPAETFQGHAASDNAFVAFDSDEPVMAIGRFPVTEPAEVQAIVDKTIRYARTPPVGPWKTRALLITNESTSYQRQSDQLAAQLLERGFSSTRIYPDSKEKSNELHTARLISAIDDGQFVVHFVGHGGRYIWRTGPPDYSKNHDLFTLDDVDKLAPGRPTPIVVSLSCYSAPFDHPNADSIGEKFLRLPDRGSVAVIAASWRNVPTGAMSRAIMEALTAPGTVGEALMEAKRKVTQSTFREQYNLLGDPALPLPFPRYAMDVHLEGAAGDQVSARLLDGSFDGEALVRWFDADGLSLGEERVDLVGGGLTTALAEPAENVGAVQVYAWNDNLQLDGSGIWLRQPQPQISSTSMKAVQPDAPAEVPNS